MVSRGSNGSNSLPSLFSRHIILRHLFLVFLLAICLSLQLPILSLPLASSEPKPLASYKSKGSQAAFCIPEEASRDMIR